jgi:uncharacterized protein
MSNQVIIEKVSNIVKERLGGEGSGHDWWHIYRVWKMAQHLGASEKADMFIVELAALLHDIADWKFHDGDEDVGPRVAKEILVELKVDDGVIGHVCEIISTMSFKGARVASNIKSIEGAVVQDADRLDAIGAMGIARTFAYGGHTGRLMYDPSIKPIQHETKESYRDNVSPTINHFYEKLLLLKDLMNTNTAKSIANERHKVMEDYLERFFAEWEGKV